MHLARLRLENVRSFARLDLPLPTGTTVLYGANAQGKSNLLEAIHVFAIGRSTRAGHDRELIRWETLGDDIPYARLEGEFFRRGTRLSLSVVLQHNPGPEAASPASTEVPILKRVKVNGIPRRASDLVGQALVVLFEPQDIELVYGSPSGRRRHLDIILSQTDRALFGELQRYTRVIAQRNPLLKSIRDGRSSPDELAYWNRELVQAGSAITVARRSSLTALERLSQSIHRDLTAEAETLSLDYKPSVSALEHSDLPATIAAFEADLESLRERELMQGVTLVGPHRDDFSFRVNGADLSAYGSRGQQRLATLSLKLAEAQFIRERTDEEPILLLDDVLSELDAPRRRYLLQQVAGYHQAILTTADLGTVDRSFVESSNVLRVVDGAVEPHRLDA